MLEKTEIIWSLVGLFFIYIDLNFFYFLFRSNRVTYRRKNWIKFLIIQLVGALVYFGLVYLIKNEIMNRWQLIVLVGTFLLIIYCLKKYINKDDALDFKKISSDRVFCIGLQIYVLCAAYSYNVLEIGYKLGALAALIAITAFVCVIISAVTIQRSRCENMSKADFSREKDYYRDILKIYTPAELSYIDDFKVKSEREIMATILNLELKNKIKIENDEIIVIDNNEDDLKMTEKYIMKNIKDKKLYLDTSKINKMNEIVIEEVKQDNLIEESPLKLTRTFLKAILIMCLITMCSIVLGKTILKGVDYIGSLDVESFRISITMVLVAIDWLYFMYYIEFYSSGQVFRRTELGEQINVKLEGLKNYISDYSLINEKKEEDLTLWEYYLVYSFILGTNKNSIEKQLDKLIYKKG